MSTPPHDPTYNVHATDHDITAILRQVFPDGKLLSSTPLPHGESYNNRIYHVSVATSASSLDASVSSFVLKVGGRRHHWKNIKTLNEVMCLKLIKFHYPKIPVPEVLAWSNESGIIPAFEFEWILMTKLSGSTLQSSKMTPENMESVTDDLAKYLSMLRRIPSPNKIGNLVDVHDDGFTVLGQLVDTPEAKGWPFETYFEYQQSTFVHNVEKLEQTDDFRPNHHLLPLLRQFLLAHLSEISLFKGPRLFRSVFTHGDLSDRNILVCRLDGSNTSKMSVSGIVDFEFSGFFPPFDEYFLGDDDIFTFTAPETPGPKSFPNAFLDKLEEKGVSTPRSGLLHQYWETATHLTGLQENIAPWWLQGVQGEDLHKGLERAAERVIFHVKNLAG